MRTGYSSILLVGVLLGGTGSALARSAEGAYGPDTPPIAPRSGVEDLPPPASVLDLVLPEVQPEEWERVRERRGQGRAYLVGFERRLAQPYGADLLAGLPWRRQDDGRLALFLTLRSPGAAGLRAELDITALPAGSQLRFFSGTGAQPLSQVRVGADRELGPLWSPTAVGDTLGIEVRLPVAADPATVVLPVARVSHLLTVPAADPEPRALSSPCEQDVVCRNETPWSNLKNAVAKILFVSEGTSYQCTATLLNDHEDAGWIPYVYTSHHCVGTAAEAATLESHWFYERAGCASGAAKTPVILHGGARLLGTGAGSDYSLLELREPAPSGAYYAGWETRTEQDREVVGIHHPQGDVKKISSGNLDGPSSCRGQYGCGYDDLQVSWASGHTEEGSSGSGLFDGAGKLIGGLWGGTSQCLFVTGEIFGTDLYGRFGGALPQLERYLDATADPVAAPTVLTAEVGEGGWQDFRLPVANPTRTVEVMLHGLNANADLYVRIGAKPTLETYDCRSIHGGVRLDYCRLHPSAGDQVYIGVRGTQAAAFSLTLSVGTSTWDFVLLPGGQGRAEILSATGASPYWQHMIDALSCQLSSLAIGHKAPGWAEMPGHIARFVKTAPTPPDPVGGV